jgi:hypothetical protein
MNNWWVLSYLTFPTIPLLTNYIKIRVTDTSRDTVMKFFTSSFFTKQLPLAPVEHP